MFTSALYWVTCTQGPRHRADETGQKGKDPVKSGWRCVCPRARAALSVRGMCTTPGQLRPAASVLPAPLESPMSPLSPMPWCLRGITSTVKVVPSTEMVNVTLGAPTRRVKLLSDHGWFVPRALTNTMLPRCLWLCRVTRRQACEKAAVASVMEARTTRAAARRALR
jgi:hypothetical protein